MTYLLLSILLTSSLAFFFKLFEKFKVNIFQALVFNYATAATIGLCTASSSIGDNLHATWFPVSLVLGLLFITIFYCISRSTLVTGVSATIVANKMSVIIPVLLAFYLYNDIITTKKILGIGLALIAVYLTARKKETDETKSNAQVFLLPVIVFIGSGIIDALVNFAQVNLLKGQNNELFLAIAFGAACVAGLIILILQLITKKITIELKSVIGGICLGIPNFFSIHYLIKALDSGVFESTVFFPVNNMGVVIVSAVAAFVFFREKLSAVNLLGIACALASIALISVK